MADKAIKGVMESAEATVEAVLEPGRFVFIVKELSIRRRVSGDVHGQFEDISVGANLEPDGVMRLAVTRDEETLQALEKGEPEAFVDYVTGALEHLRRVTKVHFRLTNEGGDLYTKNSRVP